MGMAESKLTIERLRELLLMAKRAHHEGCTL
jgi:hypothetical protein